MEREREVAVLMACIASIARDLQEKHLEIVEKWRGGATLGDVAKEYDLVSRVGECKDPMAVAKSVVKAYLIGMNGGEYIEEFPGMVSFDEYREVSWERSRQNIIDYNAGLDDSGAFVGLSDNEHSDFSRWAATRRKDHRGKLRTSISLEEEAYSYNISLDLKYKSSRGVSWNKVVVGINFRFHDGESVRNVKAARGMVYRVKTSFS